MSGYAYSARVRLVPEDGAEVAYNLSTIVGSGGPVSTTVGYEPIQVSRARPDRHLIRRSFGFRPFVEFAFELEDSNDEAMLADIVSALNRERTRVYLSLDGGVTEKEVVMDSNYARDPLAGKYLAGIATTLTLRAVALIESVPAVAASGLSGW